MDNINAADGPDGVSIVGIEESCTCITSCKPQFFIRFQWANVNSVPFIFVNALPPPWALR